MNTQEDILVVHCSSQSVFRVRPATCGSSMLSGEPALPLVSSLRCTHTSQPGHASSILCASFSPMGKLLATASGDNNLWDLDMETELCEWRRGVGRAIIFSVMYHSVQVTDMGQSPCEQFSPVLVPISSSLSASPHADSFTYHTFPPTACLASLLSRDHVSGFDLID